MTDAEREKAEEREYWRREAEIQANALKQAYARDAKIDRSRWSPVAYTKYEGMDT